jgi:hypothetical protein
MKKEKTVQNELEKTIGLMMTIQSVVYQIDALSKENVYRHLFKRDTNIYYEKISKKIEEMTNNFKTDDGLQCIKTSEEWVKHVKAFDDLAASVRMIKKIEEI